MFLGLLAIAALAVIVAAILVLARHRRRSAEQHLGETFTAAQFTALCDNMSWYGRSVAGPVPPVVRPEFISGPAFTLPQLPSAPPPAGRHSAPPAT